MAIKSGTPQHPTRVRILNAFKPKRGLLGSALVLVISFVSDAAELVSKTNDGLQVLGRSEEASVSADGQYVVFESNAPDFVAGDIPPPSTISSTTDDIFVVHLATGTVELISVGMDGLPANASREPAISGDGRFVAFQSFATNLVPDDTNEFEDIFVFDRQTQTMERINLAPDGAQANDRSDEVAISDDGQFVAFESVATNLVDQDSNEERDIFVWSRQTGTIERVSIAHDGSEPDRLSDQPSLSADGRYVVFESNATNLVPDDTNSRRDIFLYDRELDQIERIDVAADGTQSDGSSEKPTVSADGRLVAFDSQSMNLVSQALDGTSNIFVKDRVTGEVELISRSTAGVPADAFCEEATMTASGRFVSFDCPGTALTDADTGNQENVYVYDRASQIMMLTSRGLGGVGADGRSYRPSVVPDAVAFSSLATNLVEVDSNDREDVFVVRLPIFVDDFEGQPEL